MKSLYLFLHICVPLLAEEIGEITATINRFQNQKITNLQCFLTAIKYEEIDILRALKILQNKSAKFKDQLDHLPLPLALKKILMENVDICVGLLQKITILYQLYEEKSINEYAFIEKTLLLCTEHIIQLINQLDGMGTIQQDYLRKNCIFILNLTLAFCNYLDSHPVPIKDLIIYCYEFLDIFKSITTPPSPMNNTNDKIFVDLWFTSQNILITKI